MIGERKHLTLFMVLGSLALTFLNSYALSNFTYVLEFLIQLTALLFAASGLYLLYTKKSNMGWKFLTIFFSISLLNTVVLFYLNPNSTIILLSVMGSVGYILVLDAIYEGKMVFENLELMKLSRQKRQPKLGVLDENREDFLRKIDAYHKKFTNWKPEHLGDPITTQNETSVGTNEVTIYSANPKDENDSLRQDKQDTLLPEMTLKEFDAQKPLPPLTIVGQRFIAAPQSIRFHMESCRWIEQLDRTQAIFFDTMEEAKARGLYACSCVIKD